MNSYNELTSMSSTKWKKSIGCSLKFMLKNLKKSNPKFIMDAIRKKRAACSSAEGVHEAILDIVKAMQGCAKSLSG